eukprot:657961-Amphidinium_carterae.6
MEELAARSKRKAVKLLRVPLYREGIDACFTTPASPSMSSLPHAGATMQGAATTCGSLKPVVLPRGSDLGQPALACQYTPATTQRPCGHPLDVHGQYSANCAKEPVRARHDSIKHLCPLWANSFVLLVGMSQCSGTSCFLESTAVASTTKKADLVVFSPGRCTHALGCDFYPWRAHHASPSGTSCR